MTDEKAITQYSPTHLSAQSIPSSEHFNTIVRMAKAVSETSLTKQRMSQADAITIMLKGYEVGIPPMEAISQIYVVKGVPSTSVQAMIALANRSRILERFDIPDTKEVKQAGAATVTLKRRDRDNVYTFTFSIEDAKKAGLWGKGTWTNYPEQMLINRAIGVALRKVVPEAISGMYPVEEIAPGTPVDADGAPTGDIVVENPNPPKNSTPPETKQDDVTDAEYTESDDGNWLKKGDPRTAKFLDAAVAYNIGDDRADAAAQLLKLYDPERELSRLGEITDSEADAHARLKEIGRQIAEDVGVPFEDAPTGMKDPEGWSETDELDLDVFISEVFNMKPTEFASNTDGVDLRGEENFPAAVRRALKEAAAHNLPVFAKQVTYEGQFVRFHIGERFNVNAPQVRLYGGRTALTEAVGDEVATVHKVGEWEKGQSYKIELGGKIERKEGKGGVYYTVDTDSIIPPGIPF